MKSVNAFVEMLKREGTQDRTATLGHPLWRLHLNSERYRIDFADDFHAEGWQQYDTDQDAHYCGVWTNPVTLTILSYTEGDWHVVQCPNKEAYNAEIADMNKFYGQGFVAITLNPDTGDRTVYRQDREQFFVQP